MLNDFPLIKYTLLFIFGIIAQSYLYITFPFIIIFSLSILSILLISNRYKSKLLKNLSTLLLVFSIGLIHYKLYDSFYPKFPFKDDYINNVKIIGIIKSLSLPSNSEISVDLFHVKTNLKQNIEGTFLLKLKNHITNVKKIGIGDTIKFTGNIYNATIKNRLWGFNYGNYLINNGYIGVIYCNKNKDFELFQNSSFSFSKIIYEARIKLDYQFKKLFSNNSYGLIRGLLLGDKSLIGDELKDTYKYTGISHILAVSGLHVGVVIYLFYLLFARFNIKIRYLLTIVSIIIFCFIAGNSISVVRASIMAIIFILLKYYNRDYSGLNSLFLTLLVVILFNPLELFNIALQLSFLCAATIILSSSYFDTLINKAKISNKIMINISRIVYYSVLLQIVTLPILLFNFNSISLMGLFANILIIPLFSVIIISSIFSIIISFVWFKLGFILAVTINFLIFLTNSVVHKLNHLSFLYFEYYSMNNNQVILYYFAIILIILTIFYVKRRYLKLVSVIIIILGFTAFNFALSRKFDNSKLYLIVLDVGQGDSFLLKLPNGKAALIDAGNSNEYFSSGKDVILPALKYFKIHTIDYLFISHIDNDHYLGVYELLGNIPIKCIFKPKLNFELEKDKELEKQIKNYEIKLNYYNANVLTISNSRIYVLNDSLWKNKTTNESSAIIKLKYGETSVLFMGDASVKTEHLLINKYGKFIDSDILKIGHHGSNTSTSNNLLRVVSPMYSIISCGLNNAYQFPDSSVVNRIKNNNSIIYRTDIHGTLVFELDGQKIKLFNHNN